MVQKFSKDFLIYLKTETGYLSQTLLYGEPVLPTAFSLPPLAQGLEWGAIQQLLAY